jgi:hypothetical protein
MAHLRLFSSRSIFSPSPKKTKPHQGLEEQPEAGLEQIAQCASLSADDTSASAEPATGPTSLSGPSQVDDHAESRVGTQTRARKPRAPFRFRGPQGGTGIPEEQSNEDDHETLVMNSANKPVFLLCARRHQGELASAFLDSFDHEGLDHKAAEREEVGLARRGLAPRQANAALRLRFDEAQQLDPLVAHLHVDGHFGHQRHAITACHHLHDRR